MTNKPTKQPETKVVVTITTAPATPEQRASWRKFWQRLLSQPKGVSR